MKNIMQYAAVLLSAVMVLSMTCCSNGSGQSDAASVPYEVSSAAEKDGFRFTDYQGDEIIDIQKVENGENLDSVCETYRFTFLSEGDEPYKIKGYISIPLSCIEARQPCQCMVYCRGGNSNLGYLDKTDTAVRCAVSGRIVIGCEHRGGNGTEGTDQYGGDDLNDVIRLIDFCDKTFAFADIGDLCVEGESRGGMMTYMTARRDKRVKKIIVCSGVSDLFAVFNEREDKMTEVLVRCIGGTPEELPEEYERRSAVFWADEIKIPVLIIHSKGDKQAIFETQALPIVEKLKDNTDCTFITYDDDVHGFHQEDYAIVKDWLETH